MNAVSRIALPVLALLALVAPATAQGTTTTLAPNGALIVDGKLIFPIGLSAGPSDPAGMAILVRQGVDMFKFQPASYGFHHHPWLYPETLVAAHAFNAAVAQAGGFSELNLCAVCGYPKAGNISGAVLASVSAELEHDPGLGLYKGADEPWWNGIPASALRPDFLAIRASDPDHLWTEFQADRGVTADFRPYGQTTNIGGIAVFPVRSGGAIGAPLSEVGRQTAVIYAATPTLAVWTTLQLCDAGSKRASPAMIASGRRYTYRLPTTAQYRFMAWDAIINGARGLNFFGGQMRGCWSAADKAAGWNWTAWSRFAPIARRLQDMNAALTGVRRRLPRSGAWEGVRLPGYTVRANTVTHHVTIGSS
jgi:hypothetical protein